MTKAELIAALKDMPNGGEILFKLRPQTNDHESLDKWFLTGASELGTIESVEINNNDGDMPNFAVLCTRFDFEVQS